MITKLDAAADVLVPLPDPPERTDMHENRVLSPSYVTLRAHLNKRDVPVFVEGYGYMVREVGGILDWSLHHYPDVIVAFGIDAAAMVRRNGYVISEAGKPPDFVLEVASESTAWRDETVKRDGYAEMEVPEYWRFDGSRKGYYAQPLSGDILVGGSYEPVELTTESDGEVRGYSPALNLYLCWNSTDRLPLTGEYRLRFWDPETEKYLPDPLEIEEIAEERDQERSARIEAEARAAEAEAEIARLREKFGSS